MLNFWSPSKKSEFEQQAIPHLDALYSTAVRLTRRESDAEDLVQETYIKAFRYFHKFEQGTHLRAWLYKIMVNTFINQYRKQQKNREMIEDWDWDQIAEQDEKLDDNEKNILDQFVSEQVQTAIQKVPEDFRTVLVLSDLEDMSYKDIADIVGCPIGTVMSRLHRGRRILRKYLRNYAVEHGYISRKTAYADKEKSRRAESRCVQPLWARA